MSLSDPWAYLIGGIAGGTAWAVGLPVGIAAAVGASVFGVKVGIDALLGRAPRSRFRLLDVRRNSPEHDWLRRADRAVTSMQELAESVTPGVVADKCSAVVAKAKTTRDQIRRLAGQASAAYGAAEHLDPQVLQAEHDRLTSELKRAKAPALRDEITRSIASLKDQLAIHARMTESNRALLARLESGVLGLERMVAQLAEILALSEANTSSVEGVERMDELADELEGLRSGLAETEILSRRALSAPGSRDNVDEHSSQIQTDELTKSRKRK